MVSWAKCIFARPDPLTKLMPSAKKPQETVLFLKMANAYCPNEPAVNKCMLFTGQSDSNFLP